MGEADIFRMAAVPPGALRYKTYTADVCAQILEHVRNTGNLSEAVRRVGGSLSGIQKVQRENAAFRAAVLAARAEFRRRRAHQSTFADLAPVPVAVAAPPKRFTGAKTDKVRFLRLLAEHGSLKAAAATMGVTADSLYDARDKDPAFYRSWRRAQMRFLDTVRSEMLARSLELIGARGSDARANELKRLMQLVEAAQEDLRAACAAEAAAPAGSAERQNLEAVRLELEARLSSLAERFGDPFAGADGAQAAA